MLLTTVKGWAQGIGALAALAVLFWVVKQSSPGGLTLHLSPDADPESVSWDDSAPLDEWWAEEGGQQEEEYDEEYDRQFEEILSMPICEDMGAAFGRLVEARRQLLQAATGNEVPAMSAAQEQYRNAIREVQACVTELRMFVAPDACDQTIRDLVSSYLPLDGELVHPWELAQLGKETAP
jgi:hypothetical protein